MRARSCGLIRNAVGGRLVRSALVRSRLAAVPALAQPPPQLGAAGRQAVRHEHDDDDEGHAEQGVPALHIGRRHVLDQRDDSGADDRSGERAGAAQDRHQQDLRRLLQRDRMRAQEQVVIDVEQARDRGPEPREYEGDEPDQPDIVAEHAHAARLVACAHQARAERRAGEAPDAEQRDREHDQSEIVEALRIVDVDAERHRARRVADAVVTAGKRIRAIGDAPDDLAERERDHHEAEPGCTQRKHAEEGGGHGRECDGEDCGGELAVACGDQQDAGIAGDAEIAGMAERDHAAIAQHHVDREREQGVDQHLRRHVDVELVADDPRHCEQEQRADGDRNHLRVPGGLAAHSCTRPNRPCGRKTRTSTIGRNSTK